METPGRPERGQFPTLYGGVGDSINRRAVLIGGLLLPIAARAGAPGPDVEALAWTGKAHVSAGGRELDLGVETRLELPQINVRSTSWILSEGREKARTLVLHDFGASVETAAGIRELPDAIAVHERQQYAIYAQMLYAGSKRRKPNSTLAVSRLPYPDIRFHIGSDGYPESAELTVDAPEQGKPRIAERLTFSGVVHDKGVGWPRRIVITQDGKPYFTLEIETFSVEFA